jgi:hypothetical protein
MLEDIKTLLDIQDDSSDAVLALMLEDAIQAALDYCRRSTLPPALESLVRGLVVRIFEQQSGGNVGAIKRGDTQITYREPIGVGVFTDLERARLNAYRKLKVR